jgi:photosystem II stability/assembly factor-like uncharacterized protein
MRLGFALALVMAPNLLAQAAPVLEDQVSGTTARLQAVSVVNGKVAWASGAKATFVRTVDGGRTWTAGQVPGADSLEFRDVYGISADRAVLLAAGKGDKSRIYRTLDGGKTWTLTFQNTDPNRFYDCIDFKGDVGIAVSDEVGGTMPLLQTTDGGKSWKPYAPPGYEKIQAVKNEGAFAASGTCVLLRPDFSVMIPTATMGRVIHVGPTSSQSYSTPLTKEKEGAGLASLAFRLGNVGIAVGGDIGAAQANVAADVVVVTRDGGRTWALGGRPPFPGPVFGVAYVPGKNRTAVVVSPKGAAWSADDGTSWRPLSDKNYWGLGFSREGVVGWLVGTEGRITKVTFK